MSVLCILICRCSVNRVASGIIEVETEVVKAGVIHMSSCEARNR